MVTSFGCSFLFTHGWSFFKLYWNFKQISERRSGLTMKALEQIMQGIEMLSLDSFKIGAILLVNIFCFFLFSKTWCSWIRKIQPHVWQVEFLYNSSSVFFGSYWHSRLVAKFSQQWFNEKVFCPHMAKFFGCVDMLIWACRQDYSYMTFLGAFLHLLWLVLQSHLMLLLRSVFSCSNTLCCYHYIVALC
jgi:hypothetical protein